MKIYDVIILGAGPAGLSAGIYAGRYLLDTLIIEKAQDGGQISLTADIENYPGQIIDETESGISLAERMAKQAERFGVQRIAAEIVSVQLDGDIKRLTDTKGNVYEARTIIIATGAHARDIGCTNEKDFLGRGISFCATCDANFYRNLEVYVVGGGDSAVEEALYLTKFARKVTIIHRRDELRAAKSTAQKAFANEKIHFMWDSIVEEVSGDGILEHMKVKNVKTGQTTQIDADPDDGIFGLFGFIGNIPNTEFLQESGLEMDATGYIPTDQDMKTNIRGVFAAGDVRVKSLRQVVTATADGAIAARMAEQYLLAAE